MAGEKQAQPYMPPNPFGVKQEYWERIQNMRLLDDTFMTAAFDNNIEATQLLLRVIIEKADLKVVCTVIRCGWMWTRSTTRIINMTSK